MRLIPLSLVFAGIVAVAIPARADSVYDFTYSGGTLSASGSFSVNGTTITSIHGVADGAPITGILAGEDGSDQQFNASGVPDYFTYGGLSFSTTEEAVNLYSLGPATYHAQLFSESDGSISYDTPVSLSISATPEPSSLALLGTGLLGAAGMIRRRLI